MLGFLKRRTPEEDETSIGNLLVSMGLLTTGELTNIVKEFRESKEELLGQFIVRKTAITEDQIEIALLKQRVLRGRADQKVYDRLLEISQNSSKRVSKGLDELTRAANQAVKQSA